MGPIFLFSDVTFCSSSSSLPFEIMKLMASSVLFSDMNKRIRCCHGGACTVSLSLMLGPDSTVPSERIHHSSSYLSDQRSESIFSPIIFTKMLGPCSNGYKMYSGML